MSTLFGRDPGETSWRSRPSREYACSPPFLSVPMTRLLAGSPGWIQIAGSSAASPALGTGSVWTFAAGVTVTTSAGVSATARAIGARSRAAKGRSIGRSLEAGSASGGRGEGDGQQGPVVDVPGLRGVEVPAV